MTAYTKVSLFVIFSFFILSSTCNACGCWGWGSTPDSDDSLFGVHSSLNVDFSESDYQDPSFYKNQIYAVMYAGIEYEATELNSSLEETPELSQYITPEQLSLLSKVIDIMMADHYYSSTIIHPSV